MIKMIRPHYNSSKTLIISVQHCKFVCDSEVTSKVVRSKAAIRHLPGRKLFICEPDAKYFPKTRTAV